MHKAVVDEDPVVAPDGRTRGVWALGEDAPPNFAGGRGAKVRGPVFGRLLEPPAGRNDGPIGMGDDM